MVKMAHASSSKFVPITKSIMCPNNVTKPTLSEVLQSDQVRRLFNQPNIIIKTIPLTPAGTRENRVSKNFFGNCKNGMNINLNNIKPPEISILPVKLSDEEKEDANLLPSKIEDKKSEITLLPIRQKLCGHYEPCENIICDVAVQQHVDQDRISPILAVNIEEDEINAPVLKHCNNEYCDALSIDHNRCRRALIKLYKCDRSRVCDICKITLNGWKSRIYHRNCTRKDEYRHNNVDRMHLLKERMRERELQILEAAKMKKNDYSDPVKGCDLAMEILRKNEELIIIPKTEPSQKPIITITTVPNTQSVNINLSNANKAINANSQANIKSVIFTIAPPNTAICSGNVSRLEENKSQSMNEVTLSNVQQNSCSIVTSTSTPVLPFVSSQNQYVPLATPPQNVQPITINNWIVSPSQSIMTTTPIQPKSFLTPIRVVPIANLISAPSLLHRQQGIPKFCIVAESVKSNSPPDIAVQEEPPARETSWRKRNRSSKRLTKPKKFFCDYCSKYFSTDWYFKMHVAKHKGEKLFFCSLCDDAFSNRYDMKKHIIKKHVDPEEYICEVCDYVCKSPAAFKVHVEMHKIADKIDNKLKKPHVKEHDPECFKESADKMNHRTTSVSDSNGVDMKKLKCKGTLDNLKKNIEISINGIKAEHLESMCVEKQHSKKLLTVNGNDNMKMNECTFVSENTNTKSFEQETIITSR